nr:MAG TPA: tail tube protein [Caudoviricetes sp.]
MEFTGSILFADESSWLTLTTESDDTVTISVRFNTFVPNQEVMSFEVTPNSGIVRLPAGEILRVLRGNGVGMITGMFAATQGTSSCSYSFSVLPCRKFAYKSLAATIFTTRPTKSPAYEGAEDRLYYYRTSGDVSTYVRFDYLDGGSSGNYALSPTYSTNLKYYDLDISVDTMLATASAKGLDVSNIVSYDVWIECSGSKSTVYSFDIKRMRLPLKTYRFLGRRGTYEYIHATGNFSRSIESETQVFVNSGIEQELTNDYSMTFEQNSGHIDSIGMNGYWLEFLAAKERYIIEKDGSERAIVVDEFKTSLTDRAVSSLTFTWHYANPNNTVINNADVALTSLSITGSSSVSNADNEAQFGVTYSPSNTTQRGVTWSIASGSDYASIDQNGLLTVKNGASSNTVKIRATSKVNTSIFADKSVTVTYKAAAVAVTGVTISKTELSLAIGDSETLVATVAPERATDKSVVWSSSAPRIASVDQSGKVTAKSAGSAVITVKTNDGSFTASCNLSVAAVLKYYTLTVNCTTSGATVKVLEYVAGQTSVKDAVDYTGPMTFKENTTVKVWCHKNGMIDSSTQTILMTSDKTVNVACRTIPSWDLESGEIIGNGGEERSFQISDPDDAGWQLDGIPEWITSNLVEGIGSSTITLTIAANGTVDERQATICLKSTAYDTGNIASCILTQEAGEYIVFADSNVEAICVEHFGDGAGVSHYSANATTSLGGVFSQNEDIESFLELDYFTGVTELADDEFNGCSKLHSIGLTNIVTLGARALRNTVLSGALTLPACKTIGNSAFAYVPMESIVLPLCETLTGNDCFYNNTLLKTIDFGALKKVEGFGFMTGASSLQSIIIRSTTPPTFVRPAASDGHFSQVPDTCLIYVPDESVDTYKAAAVWKTRAAYIRPLSELE